MWNPLGNGAFLGWNCKTPKNQMWQKTVSACFSAVKPYFLVCNYATKSNRRTFKIPTLMKTLEEKDVGIFCYISQLPGFRGILKQRFLFIQYLYKRIKSTHMLRIRGKKKWNLCLSFCLVLWIMLELRWRIAQLWLPRNCRKWKR